MAALFNAVIERTARAFGVPAIASMQLVQDVYAAVSGWSPSKPGSDQGARITDVLTYFARHGVDMGRGGPEAGLWTPIATADHTELRQTISLLGSATIGLLLPDSARVSGVWDVPPGGPTGSGAPGSWGAHCIILAGYDRGAGLYYGITWGGVQPITERFLAAYMDEAYAVFAPGELLGVDGMSPEQFDFATLRAALDSL